MNRPLLLLAFSVLPLSLTCAADLGRIPSDEAKALGSHLAELAGKMDDLQVDIDPNPQNANGVHVPNKLGALLVPQKDLREGEELAAQLGTEAGAPIGYLFTYRLLPVADGEQIERDQLLTVELADREDQQNEVQLLLLTVRQLADDDYRLYGYGQGDEPVIDAGFAQSTDTPSSDQAATVEIKNANQETREADIVVTVFGQYQAAFRVRYAE